MIYRNTETGDTRGQGFARLVNRHGTVETNTDDDGKILRAVIEQDGTHEEWVLVDDSG